MTFPSRPLDPKTDDLGMMRQMLLMGVAAALVLWQGLGHTAEPEDTGPIAVSGDAEIDGIDIARRKAAYAARGADLTTMTVGLWFPADWKGEADAYLVKLTSLDPVVDDTGKVLSTHGRLADIRALRGEVQADCTPTIGGRTGPVLQMVLEVPARRATAIRITGKAEVSRARYQTVRFDLATSLGKSLDHPLLRRRGFKVRPLVQVKGGDTLVTLQVPAMHDYLVEWDVEAGGQPLGWNIQGVEPGAGGVQLEQWYAGPLPKGCPLALQLAVPVETRTFAFDFRNVELP